ncbi:MFS transporter [Truncatella angustata]|uniref:MFS transporter n=1 Tax=Truncatella angustata TaxID=152316 RepID=A0A9P8UCQ2_9PEZI|nr:MFS transporter [Truncatella angustata]KAH6647749.1 MFS transporter [Truncatella angustata]
MDETQPLLPSEADRAPIPESDQIADKDLVTFDPDGDTENPLDWPIAYKWSIVALLALMAFTVTFTCISVVPVANRIVSDLDDGRTSKSASVLLVTIWELGEAAGPLFIAPLSEMYGRWPVINICNVLFILATLMAVLSESSIMFIAARALTGVAVATNVLNPAIVGDLFPSEHRGTAMSLISLAPLTGGAVGPLLSIVVAEGLGWRAVCWMSIILAGVAELLFLTCYRETYKVPILRRKAARLRAETGNDLLKTAFDEDVHSVAKVREAVLRPLIVFLESPVLQLMSLFSAVVFTFFYVMSTTLPDISENIYHMEPTAAGAAYISFSVGALIVVILLNNTLDKVYVELRKRNKGLEAPEYRLPFVILGAIALPLAIAFYGWVPQLHLPLWVMILAIVIFGAAMQFAFLPVLTYIVDASGIYSASSLTALIVTRCLMGTFLPLLTTPLVESFGYGWGFTILAAMMLSLAPIPIFLYRYGQKWRQSCKYTKDQ